MPINPKQVRNILVIRNDRFGEFLLNIPALRALRETYADARITLIVNPYVSELAKKLPFIDEVIEEELISLKRLRAKRYDMAVMLVPSKEFNILTYLAGIPVRVGYARKWGFLLTHKIADKKHLGEKHEVEYNLELVGLVGANTKDKSLFLPVEDSCLDGLARDFHLQDFNNLIALHPWTSDPVKQWPLENFCELARRLLDELGVKIAVVGGQSEFNKSQELFRNFDSNLLNLTGKTTLNQLAALLKKCRLLISGDSGPVHLACSVGTPVLALFKNDIPGKSSRRWGPWGRGNAVIEKNSLSDISAQEVFDKVREVLR